MNWLTKISNYTNELAYLRDYLKGGFNPYDYKFYVTDYLRSVGANIAEDVDEHDFGDQWLETASDQDKESFREYLEKNVLYDSMQDQYDQPSYEHMEYRELVKPTWLLHFTNDADSISMGGFEYGHEDLYQGLHLTTNKRNRQQYPGYNFAVYPGSRDARGIANSDKYGKEAVLFWSAGIEAYHYGDEEHQVIFWGPSVNPNMIFPITKEYDNWQIIGEDYRVLKESEDIDDIVQWIQTNWRMYNQIHGR